MKFAFATANLKIETLRMSRRFARVLSHGIVRSYSVAALVLTIKPRQTNTQCYRVIQLRSVSIQQEELKEEILLDRNYMRHR